MRFCGLKVSFFTGQDGRSSREFALAEGRGERVISKNEDNKNSLLDRIGQPRPEHWC